MVGIVGEEGEDGGGTRSKGEAGRGRVTCSEVRRV